jgi:hypothetical protein
LLERHESHGSDARHQTLQRPRWTLLPGRSRMTEARSRLDEGAVDSARLMMAALSAASIDDRRGTNGSSRAGPSRQSPSRRRSPNWPALSVRAFPPTAAERNETRCPWHGGPPRRLARARRVPPPAPCCRAVSERSNNESTHWIIFDATDRPGGGELDGPGAGMPDAVPSGGGSHLETAIMIAGGLVPQDDQPRDEPPGGRLPRRRGERRVPGRSPIAILIVNRSVRVRHYCATPRAFSKEI